MSGDVVNTKNEKEIKDKWYIFRIQSGREESMLNALKNSFKTFYVTCSVPLTFSLSYSYFKKERLFITYLPAPEEIPIRAKESAARNSRLYPVNTRIYLFLFASLVLQ